MEEKRNNKVFFVNPPFKAEYGKFSRESRSPSIGHSGVLYYPLWLIYAAALVEKYNFKVEFLDAPANLMNEEKSMEYVNEKFEGTKLVVVNTSTPSIYSDVKFVDMIKKAHPEAFVVLVGTHPSATVEETLRLSDNIDAIARKEYDNTIKELAIALDNGTDLSEVRGISYLKDGEVVNNEDAEYIVDLDEIPFAAKFIKEHLDIYNYSFPAATFPSIQIFTGRGCPARCNFCVYPQIMHGHNYRKRSEQNVIDEMIYIRDNFPEVKEIVIEDDTFTIDKKRVLTICELMVKNNLHKRFKWLCNARANLDIETMKAMKKAGCRLIIPGVESFNQEILNNIKKGTTTKQIETYMSNAKKAHLLVHACYMVGNKGETKETMNKTLEAALKFNTDTAQFFPLIPYPGTEAYNWAKENGYINGKYDEYCKEDGTLNCVLNLPGISADELVEFCDYARKKYYLRPRYILYRGFKGLTNPDDLKRSLKAFKTLKKHLFKKK